MADERTKQQLSIVDDLQDLWLKHMKKLLEDGSITSTDLATLARVLLANGWSLDRNKLPQTLRDKLTGTVDPSIINDDDEDVVGAIGL